MRPTYRRRRSYTFPLRGRREVAICFCSAGVAKLLYVSAPQASRKCVAPRRTLEDMTKVVLATPIGGIGVHVDQGAVCGVSFGAVPGGEPTRTELERGGPVLSAALDQLRAYFAGERTDFDLPVVVRRGSEFERAVWTEIAAIPYGETMSYGAIARAVGDPGAAQAVGHACNRNPLPIIVACHRVI